MAAESSQKSRYRKPVLKPKKPYPDFPLTPHNSGKWMKKIRGRIHYFGRWANRVDGELVRVAGDGWKDALDSYTAQRDDLFAGRTPRPASDKGDSKSITVGDLCELFLGAKLRKLESNELSPRTYGELVATTDRIVSEFGSTRRVEDLTPDDFGKLRAGVAKRWGVVRLANEITRVRSVFTYGVKNGKLTQQVPYGSEFDRPSKSVKRKAKNKVKAEHGEKMFEAEEIQLMLSALQGKPVTIPGVEDALVLKPKQTLLSMILLGVNCGFGQTDIANLPLSAIDLKGGWITFPRPKTGIARKAKLWPETVDALKAALAARPTSEHDEDAHLAFLTQKGKRWIRENSGDDPLKWTYRTDLIGNEFAKLMRKLKLNGRRGFYALRHSFQTIAENGLDFIAVKCVMGHADQSISDEYRERLDDVRLVNVAETVHAWLFGNGGEA